MTPDWLLLRHYAKENSQEAFAALTTRYLNLVYSVCLREVHDPDLAQDVTQTVFLLLAHTAPTFRSKTALPGWLFRTARFAAQNARTREQRRRRYEEKAVQEMQQNEDMGDPAWVEIEPLLNQSLAALREGERQGVLLRYFQGLSFAETGAALGLSEEAARKRVTRSLEKMRRFLASEGVIIPVAALTLLLPTHAVKAAPAAVAAATAQLTTGLIPVPVFLLLKGAQHAMKIARLKTAAAGLAVLLVLAAYPVLTHAGAIKPKQTRQAGPTAPAPAVLNPFAKTAVLSGRLVYADGRPAPSIHVVMGLQDRAEADLSEKTPQADQASLGKISGDGTVTGPDGSYRFAVAPNLPYNILVDMAPPPAEDDRNAEWVAAANEGAVGKAEKTVVLPNLILTKGVFVAGTVTDQASGKPVAGVYVGVHGPHRPTSTGMVSITATDTTGQYRLRVIPGQENIYIADQRYNPFFVEEAKKKGLNKSLTVSQTNIAKADFQVSLQKKP